jgi:hypothetical protein
MVGFVAVEHNNTKQQAFRGGGQEEKEEKVNQQCLFRFVPKIYNN